MVNFNFLPWIIFEIGSRTFLTIFVKMMLLPEGVQGNKSLWFVKGLSYSEVGGTSLHSSDAPGVCNCILLFSCLTVNSNFCAIPSPWSVLTSVLICFFGWVLFLIEFTTSKSDPSLSAYLPTISLLSILSRETELVLGGSTGGDTCIALVLSLLVFNSFERDSMGLPTFKCISYHLCSLSNLSNSWSLSLTYVVSPVSHYLVYFLMPSLLILISLCYLSYKNY